MRCKVGDLAIAHSAMTDGNRANGAIVLVVGPAHRPGLDWSVRWQGHPCPTCGDGTWAAFDSELTPLRPDEGTDEMIRIAGLPRQLEPA